MRYKCVILDHDDTVAESSRAIHHPAHREVMRLMRPELRPLDFDEWMLKNFEPGVMEYLQGELGMDTAEIQVEHGIWRSFSARQDAPFFDGVVELLEEFAIHGSIAVVSHSEVDVIERNYAFASQGRVKPDLIYGWDFDPKRRKPSPWPVHEILRRLGLSEEEVIVVDDLKPGVEMAREAGVAIAGAGWAYDIPRIRSYMRAMCDFYFDTVAALHSHLLGD